VEGLVDNDDGNEGDDKNDDEEDDDGDYKDDDDDDTDSNSDDSDNSNDDSKGDKKDNNEDDEDDDCGNKHTIRVPDVTITSPDNEPKNEGCLARSTGVRETGDLPAQSPGVG